QTSVNLTINISEGDPVRVERVTFTGFEPLPEQHRTALDNGLPLKAGQPLDRALLQASREAPLDERRDHGYPYATVKIVENPGSSERERVVLLTADAGPLARFGPIEINGNVSVDDNVVRRQLTYRPGQIFRQSALQESQRRLYGPELFDFANVEPLRQDEKPPEVPTRVTVTEGKHQKVNFGVGYGTEEKGRVQVDWRHVNFLGGARTAGVLARYSALDKGVRVNFKEPYLFGPRNDLTLTGQSWHTDEPAFTLDTNGGRVTFARQLRRGGGPVLRSRPTTTLSLTYANEYETYTISNEALQDLSFRDELIALGLDPRFGTGRGTRSAISFDGGRNTTNNLLDAKQGYVAALHLEQAGKWLAGTWDYYEVTGELRLFRSLSSRVVAAAQARAGGIDAFGSPELQVPFFKRYFLGGATNLRGWGRYEVSPLSAAGLPIGGFSFLNFSTELRANIWRSLGAVIFLDGGNVLGDRFSFDLQGLRYDVGPGLRYQTPIGPIRADMGFQLNPIPGLLVFQHWPGLLSYGTTQPTAQHGTTRKSGITGSHARYTQGSPGRDIRRDVDHRRPRACVDRVADPVVS
ncbi:MAG: BamA/TamA family outer membrane protein, partial [Acidobacteria bacterium]|nr:BamA/TamA family outer membrane protein [Acidobacteriota bacterium]